MKEMDDNKTRLRDALSKKSDKTNDATRISNKEPASTNFTRIKQPTLESKDNTEKDPNVTQYKASNQNSEITNLVNQSRAASASQSTSKKHAYSLNDKSSGHHGVLKERFILAKIIGTGGMGVVYKAKDLLKVEAKDRDPYVAIKVLSEEFKAHPEAFISLQRESRKSQRIAHPNIVNVYDFDRHEDIVFMTMEYMDGKPLDQIIRQYKSTGLPTDDAWDILQSICKALMHAHAGDVIHSDLKPGNIFVTKNGITKIFDFGIARAVAKATHLEDKPGDRTVFDAGNLGALTPAYASLEMLEGEKPDVRDDIYALGCVAYELFTGDHPFNKVPADEAERQGLKVKKINNIKKRQWRAIEMALAFKKEDRITSVEQFYNLITTTVKRSYTIPIAFIFIFLISITGYSFMSQNNTQGPSENEIRDQLEYKIQINFHKSTIENLVKNPDFSPSWEEQLWTEFGRFKEMLKSAEKWMDATQSDAYSHWFIAIEKNIYQIYLTNIRQFRELGRFSKTRTLIKNAKRYTLDYAELEHEEQLLASAISNNQKRNKLKATLKLDKKKKVKLFNVAYKNVNQQLLCQSKLNMRNLDVAIRKLKSYNLAKYRTLKENIISRLSSCITELGKPFPEKAIEYKKTALRIFDGHKKIAAIRIVPRDPCNSSIAGLGGRGKRTICQDKLKGVVGAGPELIVVVGRGNIKTFAIGKYEVSIKEINLFCRKSKKCKEIKGRNENLPITNIKFQLAKAYMKWLRKKTNKKYRLPTMSEWLYAAKTNRESLDPNRNCFMRTRGIDKGDELLEVHVGKPNSWGMVNYVGNAQEWVYAKGRKLVAIGGSYNSPMEHCNLATVSSERRAVNLLTGFRILREMKK